MRVLLSTIGSRGEVQPLVALASRLRELGHEVRACVPPDFRSWLEGLGFPVVPVGPELRATARPGGGRIDPGQRSRMVEGTVAAQFAAVGEAARGCDLVVGCGALQVAAPSVAELSGAGYVHVHYCPVTLPSPHHAPPPLGTPRDETASNTEQWAADARHWNDLWGPALNTHRTAAGLAPVGDVRGHVFTDRPWLAADPALAPCPGDADVVQTGAWILPEKHPLPPELAAFLDAGDAPVYFGLGSMAAPGADVARVAVDAARAHGRRVIVSRGWADLPLTASRDCLLIGEVDHRVLFPRVAAVVHHGGAGTTTTAARAGVPQVVVSQRYDQHYWAARAGELGIGIAHAPGMPTVGSLTTALDAALGLPAGSFAGRVRTDGADIAAKRLSAS